MSRRARAALLGGIVLLVVGVGAFWALTVGSDPPPPASLADLQDELTAEGATAPAARDGIDGLWRVAPSEQTFVGYRIQELYGPGATLKTEVAGRTGDVSGTIRIEGTRLVAAELEVDMTTLRSDRSRRDETLKIRGLETDRFPTATFAVTDPVDLGPLPRPGAEVTVEVPGQLTLHGRSRPATFTLTATWTEGRIAVEGRTEVVLADHGIEAISIPSFVQVDDRGTLELLLLFEPA